MVEELNFLFYWRGYVSIETLVLCRVVEYNRVIWYYQLS